MITVHPSLEGTNVLGSKDNNGREFIREIVETPAGTIRRPRGKNATGCNRALTGDE